MLMWINLDDLSRFLRFLIRIVMMPLWVFLNDTDVLAPLFDIVLISSEVPWKLFNHIPNSSILMPYKTSSIVTIRFYGCYY